MVIPNCFVSFYVLSGQHNVVSSIITDDKSIKALHFNDKKLCCDNTSLESSVRTVSTNSQDKTKIKYAFNLNYFLLMGKQYTATLTQI